MVRAKIRVRVRVRVRVTLGVLHTGTWDNLLHI